MQRLQLTINWTIVLAEASHVFCCVLPTIFSVLSLLAGAGLIGALPHGIVDFHEIMHRWELPVILTSGAILLLGWGLHYYSHRVDCHSTGCVHGSCTPKKNRTATILAIASVLFIVNITVYAVFHRGMDADFRYGQSATGHATDGHAD